VLAIIVSIVAILVSIGANRIAFGPLEPLTYTLSLEDIRMNLSGAVPATDTRTDVASDQPPHCSSVLLRQLGSRRSRLDFPIPPEP